MWFCSLGSKKVPNTLSNILLVPVNQVGAISGQLIVGFSLLFHHLGTKLFVFKTIDGFQYCIMDGIRCISSEAPTAAWDRATVVL